MDDALFGPDGTQAAPPPPTYPDALTASMEARVRVSSPAQPVHPRPLSQAQPQKPRNRPRQQSGNRRRPAAPPAQKAAVPATYEAPQSIAPAQRTAIAPRRRRTGATAIGWLITLMILGSLGFDLLQGLFREIGILR